jgi:antirestriction protein ArdC
MPSQAQLRESITQRIIAALESGSLPPWRQPWSNDPAAGPACNVVSHKKYRGINPLLLACASARHNLHSKFWGTFNQWRSLGGHVMRRPDHVPPGEWGTAIIFWSRVTKLEENEDGEEEEKDIVFMRSYTVFNIDQVEGEHLDHLRVGHSVFNTSPLDTYQEADRVIAATKADIRYGGNAAYYSPTGDYIQMPLRGQFEGGEWHETMFHELCHWSEPRLNWKPGEGGYALAELVAEIGSCYLASELSIPLAQTSVNHASYVQSWLQSLRNDHRFIFQASSQASKAADYILSFSRTPAEEIEEALVE